MRKVNKKTPPDCWRSQSGDIRSDACASYLVAHILCHIRANYSSILLQITKIIQKRRHFICHVIRTLS